MRSILFIILLSFICIDKNVNAQDTLIHAGATWKYFNKDTALAYYWYAYDFNDNDWAEGRAQFGYGDDDEATVLDYGPDPRSKKIANYFRKSFVIDNPDAYMVYLLKLVRDDGAIVYINGREVWRTNMPEGLITDSTQALRTESDEEESIFFEYVLSPNYFIKGKNIISVSIHQSRAYTSDCSFDFELIRHNDLFSVNHLLRAQQGTEQILNKSFSLLSIQLELENKENEINHLTLKNENLRNYGILLIIVFFVLLLVVFYLIIRNIKQSHLMENKIQSIKNELSQKNKEIVNYALNAVQHKQFLKVLKEEIVANNVKHKFKSHELDLIVSKLSYHDDHEDEWEKMKAHFDSVHSGFFSRLKEQFPNLTQSELQHCSYIKLQLPTKEIARMLNIDPKSVQASRYRIKKKMNLDLNSDLRSIIETF